MKLPGAIKYLGSKGQNSQNEQDGQTGQSVGFGLLALWFLPCLFLSACKDKEQENYTPRATLSRNVPVAVLKNGENIDARYGALVDAIGLVSRAKEPSVEGAVRCTATSLGSGLAVTTAGCVRPKGVAGDLCKDLSVTWGQRQGRTQAQLQPFVVSRCARVLDIVQNESYFDYALLEVVPDAPQGVNLVNQSSAPSADTKLTSFAYTSQLIEGLNVLTWLSTCRKLMGSNKTRFAQECDREGQAPGAPLFDEKSLNLLGIATGATGQNNAIALSDLPIEKHFERKPLCQAFVARKPANLQVEGAAIGAGLGAYAPAQAAAPQAASPFVYAGRSFQQQLGAVSPGTSVLVEWRSRTGVRVSTQGTTGKVLKGWMRATDVEQQAGSCSF